jgi:hypothetical protein
MLVRFRNMRFAYAMTAVLALAMVGMVLLAHTSSASIYPVVVRGYVWDNKGNTVPDTPITINILYQSNGSVRSTWTTTTSSIGFYSKSIDPSGWDIGDTIQVIATHGADQRSNSTVATDAAIQYVNVTFPYEIPEFGPGLIGLLAAGGAVAAVGVALTIYLKRK